VRGFCSRSGMMNPSICQRATRYAISWGVKVRRIDDARWSMARGVNLSVSGILVHMPRAHRIGERIEGEIDCVVRPGRKTVLRGVGEVVRNGNNRRTLAAIHFDVNGASIVSSNRRQFEEANGLMTPPAEANL
jgi:hypothetical protein